jgi:hypothetical protein
MSCPGCGASTITVIESRLIRDGVRRRRKICKTCSHRWTEYEDSKGQRCCRPKALPPSWLWKPRPRKLTEADVARILIEDATDAAIAKEIGISRQMVASIRTGRYWSTFRPDLPRREGKSATRSCETCDHWTGVECDFGFPDPIEDGLSAAADCSMYFRR